MIPNLNIYISSRNKVTEYHDKDITHHVSIAGKSHKRSYTGHFPRKPITLDLYFDDIFGPLDGYHEPNQKDIDSIILLAKNIKDNLDKHYKVNLLLNCEAGISRSTAAAYIILCFLLGKGKEADAFRIVLEIRPHAIPNELMVEIADKTLDANNMMVNVLMEYKKKLFI
jgi:predicted protein tyrosine phosphatase